MSTHWIDIATTPIPLETEVIVSHKYGVEAIHFFLAKWRYWYTGNPVEKETLDTITHWWPAERCITYAESISHPTSDIICTMKGQGVCPYEIEGGKCRMPFGDCVNQRLLVNK